MARGMTSKHATTCGGAAVCQCPCGWQRSIISGDAYRVKRLQMICLKQHRKKCEVSQAEGSIQRPNYGDSVINTNEKNQKNSVQMTIKNMYDGMYNQKENVNK